MRKIAVLILFVFAIAGTALALTPAQKRAAQLKKKEVQLQEKIKMQELKLKKLREEEGEPEPGALPRLKPLPPVAPPVMPLFPVPPPKREKPMLQPALEAGLSLGFFANIPAVGAELRWHNLMEMERVSAKTGVIYAQGEDANKTNRRHVLLFLDGIYRLDSMAMRGAGTWAGQVYVGLDSRISKREALYVELGYGYLRTGFSPTYRGLNASIGYRWSM